MPRKHHHLKVETEYYQAIETEDKTFEIRKNDRGFKVHDLVYFNETVEGVKTGRAIGPIEITYVLTDKKAGKHGLSQGHCVFSFSL